MSSVDDDSGKQARLFPCLAILRYTVATVVTVLAVVVIVMVITVGVRPDDVSVSVVQGHVTTSDLWNETTTYGPRVVQAQGTTLCLRGVRTDPRFGRSARRVPHSESGSCFGTGGVDGVYRRPPTKKTVYTPVDALNLELVLSVDNKSGRGSISCKSINVTLHAGTSTAAGMKIAEFHMLNTNFNIKPQTSHKISAGKTTDNTTVLEYIAKNYGGQSSFTGVVEVTMNTSSVVYGHSTGHRIVTLVCSQVDFSVGDATATATSVQCA